MRKIFSALVIFIALMVGSSDAQVQSGPGFFGSVDGSFLFYNSSGPRLVSTPANLTNRPDPGNGGGIDGKFGWSFGTWDIALGGSYHDFSSGDAAHQGQPSAFKITDSDIWNIDGESGYTIRGTGYSVRPFAGVRYLQLLQRSQDNVVGGGPVNDRTRTWGVGPHIGVDGTLRLFGPVSMFAGTDVGVAFGKTRNKLVAASFEETTRDSRTMWQVGAKLGLDWEMVPLVHIAGGYRMNFTDSALYDTLTRNLGGAFGRSDVLEHGPFLRLNYNWGAAR